MRLAAALAGLVLAAFLLSPAGSQSTTKNVSANVTFHPQIAIAASPDLSAGVSIPSLTAGTKGNNGSKNFNPADGNNTTYYINASATNSVKLDICVNASGNLTAPGGETILLAGNFTWNDSRHNTSAFATSPGVNFTLFPGTKANTTTILPGERVYFRFFLNVPDNQPAGNYANVLSFRAKTAGSACS